jgi:pimeloyl-ACP methyl ester carboxylesterase
VATFCLIHGAWHESSCWDELVPVLEERGHRVLTPDLPLHDPELGFEARIGPALEALNGIDGPVVIVGHSQGTAYSCLLAAKRPGSLLVYLCPRLNGFEELVLLPAEARNKQLWEIERLLQAEPMQASPAELEQAMMQHAAASIAARASGQSEPPPPDPASLMRSMSAGLSSSGKSPASSSSTSSPVSAAMLE